MGMLQCLWEHGFIDSTHLKQYRIDRTKDMYGAIQVETSLKYLLSNCKDFEEEESLLQAMGQKMAVSVDRTPKYHCELAGEGIEYSLGCAKNLYCQKPLSENRKKETFRATVRQCLSRDNLTTQRIQRFSKGARDYICAYYALHHEQNRNDEETNSMTMMMTTTTTTMTSSNATTEPNIPTLVKIEKLVNDFKTHWCALDFDHGFIAATIMKKKKVR